MKKFFLVLALQLFLSTYTFSQNLLSPVWKISFSNTSETNLNQIKTAGWRDVNLLLSWERQDYFWLDGDGCIVNDFSVTSLFDDDIPPHLGFSPYNRISAPKSFQIYPELGHLNDEAHSVQIQFLKNELGF